MREEAGEECSLMVVEEEEDGKETRIERWGEVFSSSPERRWMWAITKCTSMSATAAETAGGRGGGREERR